jgi:hypothetical protein
MKNIYRKIILSFVKAAKTKAEDKGVDFNEKKSIKKHEAFLPILFFYVLIWILGYIAPALLMGELLLPILLVLILRGINHYFGWIKIIKKD